VRTLALLLAAAFGCGSGDRIAECDRLVAVASKVGACKKLDRAQRAQVDQAVTSIREALDKLDDVGLDRAPPGAVSATGQSCAKQAEDLRLLYEKLAPECVR